MKDSNMISEGTCRMCSSANLNEERNKGYARKLALLIMSLECPTEIDLDHPEDSADQYITRYVENYPGTVIEILIDVLESVLYLQNRPR